MNTYIAARRAHTPLYLTNPTICTEPNCTETKGTILLLMPPTAMLTALQENLKQAGYGVRTACTGQDLLAILHKETLDLLLLYLMLPDREAFEICVMVRHYSHIPMILLSEQKNLDDLIFGLTMGADAYIAMPFSLVELDLRIQATLRRAGRGWICNQAPEVAAFTLDHGHKSLRLAGRKIALTPIEYQLLNYLLRYPGIPITKPQLAQVVWSFTENADFNFIEVMMWRLRKKIESNPAQPQYLITVRGSGYQLNLHPRGVTN